MADPSLPRLPVYILGALRDGYSITAQPRQLRTQMDSGISRVRNLVRRPWYDLTLQFRMTRVEFTFWTAFYQNECNYGANWVVMPLSGPATIASPIGLFDAEVRLKEAPKDSPLFTTVAWGVELHLECRNYPRPTVADGYAAIPGMSGYLTQFDIDINRTIAHG